MMIMPSNTIHRFWEVLPIYWRRLFIYHLKKISRREKLSKFFQVMYRSMADYEDVGGGTSWGCIYRGCTGAILAVLNALYSCLCACWSVTKAACCPEATPIKVNVTIIGNEKVTTMVRRQCHEHISAIQDSKQGDLSTFANKIVWVTNYLGDIYNLLGADQQQFERIRDKCKEQGKDLLFIYAGLPIEFTCSCWDIYSKRFSGTNEPAIRELITQNRFLTVTTGYDLSSAQRKRMITYVREKRLLPLSVVGFSSRIRDTICEMVQKRLPVTSIKKTHLARDSDFRPEDFERKVLLLCSFTERNNIMVPRPDVGELTGVYEIVQEKEVDVIVMYAGVPADYPPCHDHELYSQYFTKLLRSQPGLKGLMDTDRFMTVSSRFALSRRQQQRLEEWLTPNPPNPPEHRVDMGYATFQ